MVIGCEIPISSRSKEVASAHWGSKWGHQPIPEHIPFGRLILYSAGDFEDKFAVVARNDESLIFLVETSGGRMTGPRLCPFVIRHMRAWLASPSDDAAIATRMQGLCAIRGTNARWVEQKHCVEISVKQ